MDRRMHQYPQSQFGFMPGRSTTDAIFILKQTIEKHREGKKNIRVTFIDLEKTHDRIPRGGDLEMLKGTKCAGKVH